MLFVADSLAPTFRIMAAVFGFIFGSFRILAETVLVTKEAATLLQFCNTEYLSEMWLAPCPIPKW